MSLLLIVLVPLVGALAVLAGARYGRNAAVAAAAAVTAVALALVLQLMPVVFAGRVVRASWPWLPALGINFSLHLDGLAALFVLLILGIGLLVIFYARYYLPADDPLGRFYGLLLLFMSSMLGIVLADNLIPLLVFWELTSLSSFLLIGYHPSDAEARRGARTALIVTAGGGLALLAGFLLLQRMAGSFELSVINAAGDAIRGHHLYVPALLLILCGAGAKSAQFPLHFWLARAMAAPTPVSAYLHSATMVKAGVFLLARLYPALSGTEPWFFLVTGLGLVTLLFAAYTALVQHDIKGLLAYSTVSHLGLITLLFGLGTPLSAVAGIFHIVNHAIFKASLFMAAGIIDHETGTRDMRRINGLWHYMPYTATLAMVAAASMAGVPLFNGFLSKEMFFAETVHPQWTGAANWLLPAGAVLAGLLAVAYSLRFIHDVFFNGEPVDLPRVPQEPPRYMKLPVEILVALCLLVGVLPEFTVAPLLRVAARGVLGTAMPEFDLAVWHGFTRPFAMSLAAMIGGAVLYYQRRWVFSLQGHMPGIGADQLFDTALAGVRAASVRFTAATENGSLRRYLFLLLLSTAVLGGAAFGVNAGGGAAIPSEPLDGISAVAFLVLAAGAIGVAVWHRHRLRALVLLGVVGLIVTLTFARFSAPDVALTALSVEVVSVVLLLLVLYFLPHGGAEEPGARRVRDAVLALAAGTGAAALCWRMLAQAGPGISSYYLQQAVPGSGGRNVVNVILVDFRGFDTLGEITVLAIAAVGIYGLLRGLAVPPPDGAERAAARDAYPLIMAMLARPLLPLALLVSVYLLLRGHNLPGGGFVAGLVTGGALILQYLASGIGWTRARIPFDYYPVIAAGVLACALTGVASLVFGSPFLTSAFVHAELPLLGAVELSSALAFDTGVYLVVVGTLMLTLGRLGELSIPDRGAPG